MVFFRPFRVLLLFGLCNSTTEMQRLGVQKHIGLPEAVQPTLTTSLGEKQQVDR